MERLGREADWDADSDKVLSGTEKVEALPWAEAEGGPVVRGGGSTDALGVLLLSFPLAGGLCSIMDLDSAVDAPIKGGRAAASVGEEVSVSARLRFFDLVSGSGATDMVASLCNGSMMWRT